MSTPTLIRRTLAIATIVDVPPVRWEEAVCGITKWCLNAGYMARLIGLGLAEVVVLTNNVSFVQQECRTDGLLRVLPFDTSLAKLIVRWQTSEDHNVSGGSQIRKYQAMTSNLRKWQYVGMTEYSAIYSSDLDVDHYFNQSATKSHAAHWPVKLHRFKRMAVELLATGCFESPFNGGNFLLKPNRTLYEFGTRTLETLRFNLSHGFNLSGRPRDLMTKGDRVRFRIARAVAHNTWDFAGGNTE